MFNFGSRIGVTRVVAVITSLTLFVAAIGIFPDLAFLRTISAIGLVVFGLLTFAGGYWRFAIACVLFGAFLFLPLDIVFSGSVWATINLAGAAGVLALMVKTTDPYRKGKAFEKYVADLFPPQNFTMITRTHDSSKFMGRFVETDIDPDLVLRDRKTNRPFAVECKWRKGWTGDKSIGLGLTWDTWKGGRYISYGVKNKMPVFVALGIGGTPDKPAETYFLKAEQLQYRFLKQEFVKSGKTIYQLGELLN
jgi:hypothetical protein